MTSDDRQQESAVKWEYFTAPILSHASQQILNNFGAQGWELVQVLPTANPDSVVGYFKRPDPTTGHSK
ncbi:DUF4177 domain-containing protein [Propionibacterium sp.]|uniref:DUF4177 domain-containing protein n=1 Tax=Propionibacterium sp. TaxID=1977903 RepID=UPI0039ECB6DA